MSICEGQERHMREAAKKLSKVLKIPKNPDFDIGQFIRDSYYKRLLRSWEDYDEKKGN